MLNKQHPPVVSSNDKAILRSLAVEIAEIAALDVHKKTVERWKKLNCLEPVRPLVWINPYQVPWSEIGIEKTLRCENGECRQLELGFRKLLYQWHHFPGDMVVEDIMYCPLVIESGNFGIQEESVKIYQSQHSDIASHAYKRLINSESDIEKIKAPQVAYNPQQTQANYDVLYELFDGILKIQKRGKTGFWFSPWDQLTSWYGAQEVLMDLAFKPGLLEKAINNLVDAWLEMLESHETQGLLSLNNRDYTFGNGTGGPGFTDELPHNSQPDKIQTRDLWAGAAAQIFSNVSPEMHEEFALKYEKRWLEKFGLVYYGCCEPLDKKIEILSHIPNLRKISMSPWADIRRGAEQIQNNYVFSWKPNPADFATQYWDTIQIEADLRKNIATIREYNCPLEIILKDVSTVRCHPERLDDWTQIAIHIAEEFE